MKYIGSILGKKAITTASAVLVIFLLLAVGAVGYMAYHGIGGPCGAGTMWDRTSCVAIGPSPPQTTAQTPAPSGTAYQMQFIGIQNAFNSTSLLSATQTAIVVFNPSDHSRSLETIGITGISAGYYKAGDRLLLYVWSSIDPTQGDEYYPEWFMVTVGTGITNLRPPDSPGTGTNPEAQITEIPYGSCTLGGTATAGYYWVISPALKLYPRALNTGVAFNIQNPDGTLARAPAVNAATGHTVIPAGQQAANYTATLGSKQLSLTLQINLGFASLAWGRPTILLSSIFPYNFQVKYLVLWVAFNTTSLQRDYTQGQGFSPVTTQPSGWWVVWKTLPTINGIAPIYSDLSNLGTAQIQIRIDTSSIVATTDLVMATYCADMQVPADAAVGSANGAPVAYGGIGNTSVDNVSGITYTIAAIGINLGANTPTTANLVEDFIATG